MPLLDKLIWHIETQLDAPLTLEVLARHCAVNVHHMCRAFQLATGQSVMGYVRARRLSRAAQALAGGEADILATALAAGYGSHEAFTRAFAAYTGALPRAVKEARGLSNLRLMEPLAMDKTMIIDLPAPEIRDHGAFRVVGLGTECRGKDISAIPGLWQSFATRYQELGASCPTYGVSYDCGEAGDFRYIAGMEWPEVPEGMTTIDIPAARYAVYTHNGHIGDLPRMITAVWNKGLEEARLTPAQTPEFERYDHRFNALTGRGVVEFWVPIE